MIRELVTGIRRSGALSYMEIVSTEPEDCLRAARLARDLGVDRLLGGTQVEEILSILEGSETAYFPFPGRPRWSPDPARWNAGGGRSAMPRVFCLGVSRRRCPRVPRNRCRSARCHCRRAAWTWLRGIPDRSWLDPITCPDPVSGSSWSECVHRRLGRFRTDIQARFAIPCRSDRRHSGRLQRNEHCANE